VETYKLPSQAGTSSYNSCLCCRPHYTYTMTLVIVRVFTYTSMVNVSTRMRGRMQLIFARNDDRTSV